MGTAFAGPKVGRGARMQTSTTTARSRAAHDQTVDGVAVSQPGGENHSLRVKLVGTKSNRNGIGAVVRVTSGGEKPVANAAQRIQLSSQSELALTLRAGIAAKEDSIEVQWPSGQVDRASAIAGEQTVTVERAGVVTSRAYARVRPAAGGDGNERRTKR